MMFRALSAYSLQTGLFRTPPETADGKPPPGPPVQPRIAPFDPSLLPPTSENTPPPWRLYTFCSFLAAISLLPPSQTGSVEGRNKAPYRGCFEKRPRRNIRPGNIGPSSTSSDLVRLAFSPANLTLPSSTEPRTNATV
jgi:hypothetical protein